MKQYNQDFDSILHPVLCVFSWKLNTFDREITTQNLFSPSIFVDTELI